MASTYNLNVTQGSTASFNINLSNADGTPMDLTGFSVRGSIKLRYSDTSPLVVFSTTINDNTVTKPLTSAQTAVLPVGMGVYDVEKYSTAYDSEVLLSGKVFIHPEVTN